MKCADCPRTTYTTSKHGTAVIVCPLENEEIDRFDAEQIEACQWAKDTHERDCRTIRHAMTRENDSVLEGA